VQVAKKRLEGTPRRVADEEDVASSVLRCLCDGAAKGRFDEIVNHDDLWRLLLTMTRQKCVDHIRMQTREKRGGGKVRGESAMMPAGGQPAPGFDGLVGEDPTPEYLAQVDEEFQSLLAALPDQVPRQVVLLRMEGWTIDEIALELGISNHAVRRKLKLVRRIWQELSNNFE
jgi:DNA-directed RNA polymerase specialized sigma24 family protein